MLVLGGMEIAVSAHIMQTGLTDAWLMLNQYETVILANANGNLRLAQFVD